MAISVNTTTSSGDIHAPGTTTTITKPAGTANTDILLVVFGSGRVNATAITVTAPAGWTAVATGFAQASGSNSVSLYAFWALGSVANLGFTNANVTAPTGDQGWICIGFIGVNNTTPIDATGTTNSSTGASSLTTNLVTVATANAWHCIAFADWLGKVPYAATSFTEKNNTAANEAAALLYNTTPKGTGSTGTVPVANSDGTTASEILLGMPFALRPASSADPYPAWDGTSWSFEEQLEEVLYH